MIVCNGPAQAHWQVGGVKVFAEACLGQDYGLQIKYQSQSVVRTYMTVLVAQGLVFETIQVCAREQLKDQLNLGQTEVESTTCTRLLKQVSKGVYKKGRCRHQ